MPVLRSGWSYESHLDASPRSAARARAFVCHHLVDHRLLHLVDPVRLVTSELVTNAVIHAQTAFTVTLARTDTSVVLSVRDHSTAIPVQRNPRAMEPGGLGLLVVRAYSRDWGVTVDGGDKTAWASFDTEPVRSRTLARRPARTTASPPG